MIVDAGYVKLLVAHQPVKPRNRRELAEMTALLESLASSWKNGVFGKSILCRCWVANRMYVSQVLSGHRPISKSAAYKLAEFLQVSPYFAKVCVQRRLASAPRTAAAEV